MADILDRRPGGGGAGGSYTTYRDQGNGSYAIDVAGLNYGWDGSVWQKLLVDGSGALKVTGEGAGGATLTSIAGTVPVTLSGTTSLAGTVPVTQSTSPWQTSISGVVQTSIQGSVPVTVGTVNVSQAGSFSVTQGTSPWQTSISGTVPVSGTFWQATQPVSISGTVAVNNSQVGGNTISTSTGNSGAGVQRIVLASDQPAFSVNQGTNPWLIAGGNVSIAGTVTTSISGTVATTLSGSPTVVESQNVGRSPVFLYVDQATGTTGETAASIIGSRALASLASSTSYVVSAGKTLRIQAAVVAVKDTSTVVSGTRWRIRVGANNTTGPVVLALEAGTNGAVSIDSAMQQVSIGDGLEISAGTSLSFSHVETATTCTTSIGVVGFEY